MSETVSVPNPDAIPTPEQAIPEREFKLGDEITVRRSSGDVEGGWSISGFDMEEGQAIVQKGEGDKRLQKVIVATDLVQFNVADKQMLEDGQIQIFQRPFRVGDVVKSNRWSNPLGGDFKIAGFRPDNGTAILTSEKSSPSGKVVGGIASYTELVRDNSLHIDARPTYMRTMVGNGTPK